MTKPWPIDEYQEPPADTFPPDRPPVLVPAAVIASTLQTLNLLDEFFRDRASTTTRAELRAYSALHGWDAVQGAAVIIDSLGIHAGSLTEALDASAEQQ